MRLRWRSLKNGLEKSNQLSAISCQKLNVYFIKKINVVGSFRLPTVKANNSVSFVEMSMVASWLQVENTGTRQETRKILNSSQRHEQTLKKSWKQT